jgi:alkylhydroperoxidase/carboxymuconolactone decarboxylase family protein YurZ
MADQTSETPVLDLLATMTAASLEATSLDARDVMLARIAALAAVGAPPISYVVNIGAAVEAGVEVEDIQGVLAAVAPIVGTARIAAAAAALVEAIAVEIAVAELEAEEAVT